MKINIYKNLLIIVSVISGWISFWRGKTKGQAIAPAGTRLGQRRSLIGQNRFHKDMVKFVPATPHHILALSVRTIWGIFWAPNWKFENKDPPCRVKSRLFFWRSLKNYWNYWNFVNKAISGNLIKNIFFFRKINLELSIVCLYFRKNKTLRSQNHSQKVKNDSCSTYAKVQYIVSICKLV